MVGVHAHSLRTADSCASGWNAALDASDELVLHRFVGPHSPLGVPAQAAGDEVKERFVVTFERLLQRLATRSPTAAFARYSDTRLAKGIEEQLLARGLLDKMFLRRPKDLHDTSKLLLFVFTREYWVSSQQFRQNTAKRPHVDGNAVAHAKDDFRRAIEARLDVRVHFLVLKATRTKVDDFDL